MATSRAFEPFIHRHPRWVHYSGAGKRLLLKESWNKGVKGNFPQHYKDFYKQWCRGPEQHIHSVPKQERFEKDEWGEIHPVQNPRVHVVYPDEFHNGLWGGEGVIKGLLARPATRHRTFLPPAAKYWWPNLFQGVVFSEVLGKHIELVMTARGQRLVDENKGLDNYLLKTPVNEVYAWRLLKLKREILLALSDKENFTKERGAIYDKYGQFAVSYVEADWTGLMLREAMHKQLVIDDLKKTRDTIPEKDIFRRELLFMLKGGHLDDLDFELLEDKKLTSGGGVVSGIKNLFK